MKNHHFDGVESIRIRLMDRLTGPFTRLLVRPMPEVGYLEDGLCSAVIRGHRINQIVPIIGGSRSPYYSERKESGWKPENFKDPIRAKEYVGKVHHACSLLAIPVGHIKLDSLENVQVWVEEYTPWEIDTVAAWFSDRETGAWLTVLRVYEMDSVEFGSADKLGLGRVPPFIACGIRPIIPDKFWSHTLDRFNATVNGINRSRSHVKLPEVGRVNRKGQDKLPELVGYTQEDLSHWKILLKRKKGLIFHGVPGTGKTYVGREFAKWFVNGDRRRIETVQFHPGFSYEDFIQGIRPRTIEGQVHYELTDGIFLRFCKLAAGDREIPYVFFIDELNRASLPRVFGELNFLLEYREDPISLSGGGPPFELPPNVHIVATMNEADRSISSIDRAFIRRFSFVYLEPNYVALGRYLEKWGVNGDPLVDLLKEINESVSTDDFQLGISFFMQDGNRLPSVLPDIWKGEIEPYLKESFYGQQEIFRQYQWDGVKERLNPILIK